MRASSRGGPRTFDPVRVGHRETDAWAAYYRREWGRFLVAAVAMVSEGFHLGPARSVVGAWDVLQANRAWAPYPDNAPEVARAWMTKFYALVRRHGGLELDPPRAAQLEVEWWRRHREHQHGREEQAALVQALVDLYAYVYAAPAASVADAARWRVAAMDLSDAWVAAGCRPEDPLLAQERLALVASYTALRAAVEIPADASGPRR